MIKFREFFTSTGTMVLGGKNAESNEDLVAQVEPGETVLHTARPGSPFVNIKGKASHQDILDAAIFCAKHSKDWRDNQEDVEVHIFKGEDIYKEKGMDKGTFGVKNFSVIKVKKGDIKRI